MAKKNDTALKWHIILVLLLVFGTIRTGMAQEDLIMPVNQWGGYAEKAAVQGDYAYFVQGAALTVLNISGDAFVKVASLMLKDVPRDIFVHGNYAYFFIANSDSAIQIIDISDPRNPFLIGAAKLKSYWQGELFVINNHAFVAAGDSLVIIDVEIPSAPQVISSVAVSATTVFATEDYAYAGSNNDFTIVDITDTADPVELGSCAITRAVAISVQGNHAYVGTDYYDNKGMYVINISDPQHPAEVGFFETKIVDGSNTTNKSPTKLCVEDNYAYIGCSGNGWLFIADVSDSSNPVEAGKLEFTEGAFPSVKSLSVIPPSAYVATGGSSAGFLKINIADPAYPEIESKFEEPWDVLYVDSWVEKLYISSYERLWVYDCSELKNPLLLGSDTAWPELRRIFVKSDTLYGLRDSSMVILNVADPGNMFEVGNYSSASAGELREVKVVGDYAYLLALKDNQSWLEIINIENLSQPFLVSESPLPGEGRDLAIHDSGEVAYVAYYSDDVNQGLQIIDINNPDSPSNSGSVQTAGKPVCIEIADTIAYLGSNQMTMEDSTWHIESFSVANMMAPKKLAEISDAGLIIDLKTYGKLLMASIHTGSIYTFDALLTQFLSKCHSPASIYFAAVVAASYKYIGIFSIDGYFDFSKIFASASLGIFGQRLKIKPKPAKVKVHPGETTVKQGEKIEFETTGYDSSGNKIKLNVKWKATGGHIDSTTGEYTATEDGDFLVSATDSSKVSGIALVHVTATSVKQHAARPIEFSLSHNYPNPFNPVTSITFSVKERCRVILTVFDIRGREVATLVNASYQPGVYRANFDGHNFSAGLYFYRIQMKDFQDMKKMLLLK